MPNFFPKRTTRVRLPAFPSSAISRMLFTRRMATANGPGAQADEQYNRLKGQGLHVVGSSDGHGAKEYQDEEIGKARASQREPARAVQDARCNGKQPDHENGAIRHALPGTAAHRKAAAKTPRVTAFSAPGETSPAWAARRGPFLSSVSAPLATSL